MAVKSSDTILFLALRLLIRRSLQETIIVLGNSDKEAELCHFAQINGDLLADRLRSGWLSRGRDKLRICYGSPIALRLSASKDAAAAMAQQLSRLLAHASGHPLWRHLLVSATSSGWLQFDLTDTGTALWLQTLGAADLCPMQPSPSVLRNESSIKDTKFLYAFRDQLLEIQYAHARCCAVLRLAAQQGLLPEPVAAFPWLAADDTLRLRHPTERRLMSQLVAVVDEWGDPLHIDRAQAGLTVGLELSRCFQAFNRACSIWGERAAQPELALARLGLVEAARTVLQLVLQKWLQTEAPIEL